MAAIKMANKLKEIRKAHLSASKKIRAKLSSGAVLFITLIFIFVLSLFVTGISEAIEMTLASNQKFLTHKRLLSVQASVITRLQKKQKAQNGLLNNACEETVNSENALLTNKMKGCYLTEQGIGWHYAFRVYRYPIMQDAVSKKKRYYVCSAFFLILAKEEKGSLSPWSRITCESNEKKE